MGRLDKVKRQMLDDGERALRIIGNDLHARSNPQIPIEEGTLRGAEHVEIHRTPNSVTMTISVDTVYAERQHEGLDFHHPRGGKAKFLEDPFKQMLPRYDRMLAAHMRIG